jgi:hypothetical protein
MKAGLALALCCFAVTVSGQPNKAPTAAQNQVPTHSPSTVLNLENCSKASTQPAKADDSAPDWNTAIKRAIKTPDGWLVIIAFLTGCAIAYQAREMARATHEMEKSTAATERSAAAM